MRWLCSPRSPAPANPPADYFDRVNCAWPIFDRARFTAELEQSYQPGSRPPPAWNLAFYMVLALGCVSDPAEEPTAVRNASQERALSYFRTGCRLLPSVLFCNRDIIGMQALLATVSPPPSASASPY